ncbi:MAG: SH3 domain-containing protein [Candidatus Binatia bacterium]
MKKVPRDMRVEGAWLRRPCHASPQRARAASRLLLAIGLAFLYSFQPVTASAQGSTAVVVGAERLFVRRGPGKTFPAFATVTKGTTVEVRELRGEWARIVTAGGQVGYVSSNFLALPSQERWGAAEASAVTPAAPARATAQAAPGTLTLTERNRALKAQVNRLQAELAARRSPPAATPASKAAPGAGTDLERLHAELQRVAAVVDDIHRRVGGHAQSGTTRPATNAGMGKTPPAVSSTAIVLGLLGLVVGWLLGAVYGRSQERGRRSRIRF